MGEVYISQSDVMWLQHGMAPNGLGAARLDSRAMACQLLFSTKRRLEDTKLRKISYVVSPLIASRDAAMRLHFNRHTRAQYHNEQAIQISHRI